MMIQKYTLALCCLAVIALPCHAENNDDLPSQLPIVTSASRLTQSVLTSPSAVTVIDRAMIQASGFIELADVFRLVPGFQVVHADGQTFSVNAHGSGWEYPNRLQILVDGRSTYSSTLSAIDWDMIGVHLEDIEKIEVVRGPAASAYGSNSFAGAINIITRTPALDDKLYTQARVGNNGEQQVLLKKSGSYDSMNYRATVSSRKNDGFDDIVDQREINTLALSAQLPLSQNDNIDTNFSYTQGEVGAPKLTDIFSDGDRSVNIWSADLNWSHLISQQEELKVKLFHNYRDENDMSESILLSQAFGVNPTDFQLLTGAPDQSVSKGFRTFHTNRSDLEFQYSKLFDNGAQYVSGAGVRYDGLASEAYLPEKGTVTETSYRVFGNLQFPVLSSFTINLGGLYESSSENDSHISPRLSVNYHLSEFQSLRASVSRAYRLPSLLEQNMDANTTLSNGLVIDRIFESDENLQAEKVTSFDIGYIGRLIDFPLSWEFKAYKEHYEDLIVYVRDYQTPDLANDYVIRTSNAAELEIYGFEGELSYRPEQNSFVRFHFNVGNGDNTRLSKINLPPDGSSITQSTPKETPRNSYGILMAKEFNSWQLSAGVYHVGEMAWLGNGDLVDAYNRLDVSVIKHFKLSDGKDISLKLVAQNAANSKYAEFRNDIEFEPLYFFSVALTDF